MRDLHMTVCTATWFGLIYWRGVTDGADGKGTCSMLMLIACVQAVEDCA